MLTLYIEEVQSYQFAVQLNPRTSLVNCNGDYITNAEANLLAIVDKRLLILGLKIANQD